MLRTSSLAVLTLAVLLLGAAALNEAIGSPNSAEAAAESTLERESDVTEVLPQESTPEEDSGPEANLPYLFAVFIITWAAFFGYVFVMSRRQNELRHEIDALKQRLAESEGTAETRAD